MESLDALTLSSPLSDPRSLVQIFLPLLAGKPLTLLSQRDLSEPERLIEMISVGRLTRITLTPVQFEMVMDKVIQEPDFRSKLKSMTHWTVSGNALSLLMGRKFFYIFPGGYASGKFLIVTYGTTELLGEATFEIFLSEQELNSKTDTLTESSGVLSAGVPMLNTSVAIVDAQEHCLPVGYQGEIVFFGIGISAAVRGYTGLVKTNLNVEGKFKKPNSN
jgi:non-ribosomal peptide synthetase component F